jgi:hypothetical protein
MQIGEKFIQNLFVNMFLEKKTLKRHKFGKTSSHAFSIGNGLKKIQFEIV